MKVEQKLVDAAGMVTIGPEHPAWEDPLKMGEVEGLFVRLDPPLNCPDVDVVRMRAQAVDLGAVAVKCQPVRRDEVVRDRMGEFPLDPLCSARSLVEKMVTESRSPHSPALRALVEETLAEQGL